MTVRFLQVEPTSRCNFTCGFCAGRSMPQSDLDPATLLAVLDEIPELEHVELQGEGEPLLHPGFPDLVAALRQRGVKLSFITNGSLLKQATVERLLDLGIEKISVSIESADPKQFQAIRGGRLAKVVRGIETLLAERKARGLDRPVVGLSITVLADTRDQLGPILDLYERLGLDGGVTMQPLERKDDYSSHYDAATRARMLDAEAVDQTWIRFRADARVRAIEARRAPVRGFFDELFSGWSPTSRRCPWLEKGLYLDRNGRFGLCCMVKDADAHSLGRVGDTPIPVVLERRAALRDQLGRGEIPAPCAGCDFARFAVLPRWRLAWYGLRGLWTRFAG